MPLPNPPEEDNKLKPCPFCGATPEIGSLGGDQQNWCIWCPECKGACVETDINTSKEDIIKAWNRRIK